MRNDTRKLWSTSSPPPYLDDNQEYQQQQFMNKRHNDDGDQGQKQKEQHEFYHHHNNQQLYQTCRTETMNNHIDDQPQINNIRVQNRRFETETPSSQMTTYFAAPLDSSHQHQNNPYQQTSSQQIGGLQQRNEQCTTNQDDFNNSHGVVGGLIGEQASGRGTLMLTANFGSQRGSDSQVEQSYPPQQIVVHQQSQSLQSSSDLQGDEEVELEMDYLKQLKMTSDSVFNIRGGAPCGQEEIKVNSSSNQEVSVGNQPIDDDSDTAAIDQSAVSNAIYESYQGSQKNGLILNKQQRHQIEIGDQKVTTSNNNLNSIQQQFSSSNDRKAVVNGLAPQMNNPSDPIFTSSVSSGSLLPLSNLLSSNKLNLTKRPEMTPQAMNNLQQLTHNNLVQTAIIPQSLENHVHNLDINQSQNIDNLGCLQMPRVVEIGGGGPCSSDLDTGKAVGSSIELWKGRVGTGAATLNDKQSEEQRAEQQNEGSRLTKDKEGFACDIEGNNGDEFVGGQRQDSRPSEYTDYNNDFITSYSANQTTQPERQEIRISDIRGEEYDMVEHEIRQVQELRQMQQSPTSRPKMVPRTQKPQAGYEQNQNDPTLEPPSIPNLAIFSQNLVRKRSVMPSDLDVQKRLSGMSEPVGKFSGVLAKNLSSGHQRVLSSSHVSFTDSDSEESKAVLPLQGSAKVQRPELKNQSDLHSLLHSLPGKLKQTKKISSHQNMGSSQKEIRFSTPLGFNLGIGKDQQNWQDFPSGSETDRLRNSKQIEGQMVDTTAAITTEGQQQKQSYPIPQNLMESSSGDGDTRIEERLTNETQERRFPRNTQEPHQNIPSTQNPNNQQLTASNHLTTPLDHTKYQNQPLNINLNNGRNAKSGQSTWTYQQQMAQNQEETSPENWMENVATTSEQTLVQKVPDLTNQRQRGRILSNAVSPPKTAMHRQIGTPLSPPGFKDQNSLSISRKGTPYKQTASGTTGKKKKTIYRQISTQDATKCHDNGHQRDISLNSDRIYSPPRDNSYGGGQARLVPATMRTFLQKQQEFMAKKQKKIEEAKAEQKLKEETEFRKNYQFRPDMSLTCSKRTKSVKKQNLCSPANRSFELKKNDISQNGSTKNRAGVFSPIQTKSRSLTQFLNDQQKFMFRTQQKVLDAKVQQLKDDKQKMKPVTVNEKSQKLAQNIIKKFMQKQKNVTSGNQANKQVELPHVNQLDDTFSNPRTAMDISVEQASKSDLLCKNQNINQSALLANTSGFGAEIEMNPLNKSHQYDQFVNSTKQKKKKPNSASSFKNFASSAQILKEKERSNLNCPRKVAGTLVHSTARQILIQQGRQEKKTNSAKSSVSKLDSSQLSNANKFRSPQPSRKAGNTSNLSKLLLSASPQKRETKLFSPVINQKSQQIAANLIKKQKFRQNVDSTSPDKQKVLAHSRQTNSAQVMHLVNSGLKSLHQNTRILQNHTTLSETEMTAESNLDRLKSPKTLTNKNRLVQKKNLGINQPKTTKNGGQSISLMYSKRSSKATSPRSGNFEKNSKNEKIKDRRLGREISEKLKEREALMKENRRQNENLVLRNFKKEFDIVLMGLGLGKLNTDMIDEFEKTPANLKPINKRLSPQKVRSDRHKSISNDAKTLLSVGFKTCKNQSQTSDKQSDSEFEEEKEHSLTVPSKFFQTAYEMSSEQIKVDIASLLQNLGFLNSLQIGGIGGASLEGVEQVTLYDNEQKLAFKNNLFTVLCAIQAINLNEHYPKFSNFEGIDSDLFSKILKQTENVQKRQPRNSSLSNKSGSTNNFGTIQEGSSVVLALICAASNLAQIQTSFSLNQSQVIKLHLTFISLFLTLKDSVSQKAKTQAELAQSSQFSFQPQIGLTQKSVSPPRDRQKLTNPTQAFSKNELNLKEKQAFLHSQKAIFERQKLAQCTFRPQVSPRSTAIAYNKVSERHLGQKEFMSTYMERGTEVGKQNQNQQFSEEKIISDPPSSPTEKADIQMGIQMTDQEHFNKFFDQERRNTEVDQQEKYWLNHASDISKCGPFSDTTSLAKNNGQSQTTRLDARIKKHVRDFLMEKKVREDRTTEEQEYEKAKHELKFKPDISKSKISYQQNRQTDQSKSVKVENGDQYIQKVNIEDNSCVPPSQQTEIEESGVGYKTIHSNKKGIRISPDFAKKISPKAHSVSNKDTDQQIVDQDQQEFYQESDMTEKLDFEEQRLQDDLESLHKREIALKTELLNQKKCQNQKIGLIEESSSQSLSHQQPLPQSLFSINQISGQHDQSTAEFVAENDQSEGTQHENYTSSTNQNVGIKILEQSDSEDSKEDKNEDREERGTPIFKKEQSLQVLENFDSLKEEKSNQTKEEQLKFNLENIGEKLISITQETQSKDLQINSNLSASRDFKQGFLGDDMREYQNQNLGQNASASALSNEDLDSDFFRAVGSILVGDGSSQSALKSTNNSVVKKGGFSEIIMDTSPTERFNKGRKSDLTEKTVNLKVQNVILEEGTGGSSSNQLENSTQKQSRDLNKQTSSFQSPMTLLTHNETERDFKDEMVSPVSASQGVQSGTGSFLHRPKDSKDFLDGSSPQLGMILGEAHPSQIIGDSEIIVAVPAETDQRNTQQFRLKQQDSKMKLAQNARQVWEQNQGMMDEQVSSLVDDQSKVNIGEEASIRLSNLLDLQNVQNSGQFQQLDSENLYHRQSQEYCAENDLAHHFVRLSNLEERVEVDIADAGLSSQYFQEGTRDSLRFSSDNVNLFAAQNESSPGSSSRPQQFVRKEGQKSSLEIRRDPEMQASEEDYKQEYS